MPWEGCLFSEATLESELVAVTPPPDSDETEGQELVTVVELGPESRERYSLTYGVSSKDFSVSEGNSGLLVDRKTELEASKGLGPRAITGLNLLIEDIEATKL